MTQPTHPEPMPTAQGDISLRQTVEGDRNQVIGSMSGNAKAIGKVETYIENQIHQPLPRQLSLHQLPNDIADFTGRDTELQRITQLFQTSGDRTAVAISAVAGMAGVGKSALAIHVAHQLRPQFPDVQLYVNLRGTNDQPLEPFEVLTQWLWAFGLDDSTLPNDLPGRVSTYRSLLAQKRAIILLDNASSEAQVRDLIPGSPTCAVLITSRRRLTGLAGVALLDLSVMVATEALDLLQQLIDTDRVQAEPEAAVQIVQLCGRLPLAIRIAGGTLKGKPHWSLATYTAKLAEEKQRLTQLHLSDLDIRSSFQLSYQELASADAHLFQFLGLLPHDFATATAAALIDWEPEATAAGLERLVEVQLLEATNEDRYQFHDLIRLFAQEQLDQEQSFEMQQAAQLRLVQQYEEETAFWSDILSPLERRRLVKELQLEEKSNLSASELEQKALRAGLDWFELERLNLIAVLTWANQLQAWKQIVSIAADLAPFFGARNYFNDWVNTQQLAVAAASQTNDPRYEAVAMGGLGTVYHKQGRWREAIEHYEQSLIIFRKLEDHHGEAQTLSSLGNVYLDQGLWQQAIDLFQQNLPVFRELGDHHSEAKVLQSLGLGYYKQGHWQNAIDFYEQSLQAYCVLNDLHGKAQILDSIGDVHEAQRRWKNAINCYEQSVQVYCELGDYHDMPETLVKLIRVHSERGHWQDAFALFQRSIQASRETGNNQAEAQIFRGIGGICHAQGNWQNAIDFYEKSLPIFRQLKDHRSVAQILRGMGDVHHNQGHWQNAVDFHRQSLEIMRELCDRHGEAETLGNLGNVYSGWKQWQDAVDFYDQSLQVMRELCDRHGEAEILSNMGTTYSRWKRWQDAIDLFQQSLEIFRELSDGHSEGKVLVNLGWLYLEQSEPETATAHWQEALTKLYPGSLEADQVAQMLAAPSRKRTLLRNLIWLVVLAFIVFNLWRGHWFIALVAALLCAGFIAFNLWRSRRDK